MSSHEVNEKITPLPDKRTDAQMRRDYINSLKVPERTGPSLWQRIAFFISTGGHKL